MSKQSWQDLVNEGASVEHDDGDLAAWCETTVALMDLETILDHLAHGASAVRFEPVRPDLWTHSLDTIIRQLVADELWADAHELALSDESELLAIGMP